MRKLYRIIVLWIIILLIFYFYNQKISISELNALPNNQDIENVLQINIIDKYNNMEKIYNNPSAEEFYEFDLIIGDIYYYNVGIRTKGSSVFKWLEKNNSTKYSFKVMLNYRNENQSYNGITEFYINSQAMDPTGMREVLVYKIYEEMGIDTLRYSFSELKIDGESHGLVTVVECVNEEYIFNKYNSNDGNLYKPKYNNQTGEYGADLHYQGDDISDYKGIFDNTKTSKTDDEDKKRLIAIIKSINEASELDKYFMDFDKVIKMIAVNKVVSNVDGIAGRTMWNFYLYEENGKIDVIAYDFNMSLGLNPKEYFWTEEDVNTFDLIEYDDEFHSILVDIIVENEEYFEKYLQYITETKKVMKEMNLDNIINIIDSNVSNIIQKDANKYYSYEQYLLGIDELKKFINQRIN